MTEEFILNIVYPIIGGVVTATIIGVGIYLAKKINKMISDQKCIASAIFNVCKFSDLRDKKMGINTNGITRVELFKNEFREWIDKE